MDLNTAFLDGEWQEGIYMVQLGGFQQEGKDLSSKSFAVQIKAVIESV